MKKKPKAPKQQTASKRTPSLRASTGSTANRSKWIRIERVPPLPAYVREALQKLADAGHVAYVVGGSVRDFLLGRETKDHDIATSANPDELCALFPNAVTVGKAFGVIKVPLRGEGVEFLEIATFREDLEYVDHRHPKSVRFAGAEEDASRRDFTVNALYYDPKTSRILDCTDGMLDLQIKMLRAIGDPSERFREDALRLLRAVRFANALGFAIEPQTEAAIRARARLIHHVSAERVRDELNLILTGPRVSEALRMLSELGLLPYVLPEIQLKPELLSALRWMEREFPKRAATLAWAVLLHDSGKGEPAKTAASVALRLKMSREEMDRIVTLIQEVPKFKEVYSMREATLLRFLRQPYFDELLALHKILALASDGNLAFHEFASSRLDALKRMHPEGIPRLIDGTDLIQLGFRPGPEFSEILRVVEDLALERKLGTKEQALEYVVQHFVK